MLIDQLDEAPDLVATDPPYSFGGSGDEHALSATVAVVLREAARRLKNGRWMLVMSASSCRSVAFIMEAVRGIVVPVRIATWCKPVARTKTRTTGWRWATVNVLAFRKGKALEVTPSALLDHIVAELVKNGRRAELPLEVAMWVVSPYAVRGGLMLDPFAGSGALLNAAVQCEMRAIGYERAMG